MTDYVKYAKLALKRPSDFGWFGFDEMFDTWGFAGINKHRDSPLVDLSNWDCAIADIKREFGDEVYDENFHEVGLGHWLVGHADQLCVKILNESIAHDSIVDEDITDYFKYVADIALYLSEEYPILDESDLSERQWIATNADIEDMANCSWVPFGQKCIVDDEFSDTVQYWLINNDCDIVGYHDDGTPYYDEKDITEAIYDLWLDNREDEEANAFWSEWEEANISFKSRRINRRNEENGQLTLEFEYDYH
jgi:hypothetical protein